MVRGVEQIKQVRADMIDNATGSMNECLTGLGYGMACRGLNGGSTQHSLTSSSPSSCPFSASHPPHSSNTASVEEH